METCLLPNIQYYSNDIRIYNIITKLQTRLYNYLLMNSKYNNYNRLEESRKLADVNVDVEDNKPQAHKQKQENLKFFLFRLLTKEKFKFLSFHSLTYVYRDKNTVLKRFEIRILFFSFAPYGRGVINYNNEFKIYYSNDVKIRQDIQ